MADQVRIEQKDGQFAVVLEHYGRTQEMDVRNTFNEAEYYGVYLSRSLKLDLYYEGKKITR